jgi:hypothetical protein
MSSHKDEALRFEGTLLVHSVKATHIWLQVIEECADYGMRVSVPRAEVPDELSENDYLEATLVSESTEWHDWHVDSIEEYE